MWHLSRIWDEGFCQKEHQFRIQVCFRFRFRLLLRWLQGMLVCRFFFFAKKHDVSCKPSAFFEHRSLKVILGFIFMAVETQKNEGFQG